MQIVIQRVSYASVSVGEEVVGEIKRGLLIFVGFEKQDQSGRLDRVVNKLLNYRIFADHAQKMNLSVSDISGELLLVPQFTLAADTKKGNRPGFSSAMQPEEAEPMFNTLVTNIRQAYAQAPEQVQTGHFGADMQISLCNDGPVTFQMRF